MKKRKDLKSDETCREMRDNEKTSKKSPMQMSIARRHSIFSFRSTPPSIYKSPAQQQADSSEGA